MMKRYLVKLALPITCMTYQIAERLKREYGIDRVSVTTEPGYFFADVPAHTEIQLHMDARVRELEAV